VSDRGIAYLKAMQHIVDLNLSGTKISDEAMRDIAQMTHLVWLGIADTKVSDARHNLFAVVKRFAGLICWIDINKRSTHVNTMHFEGAG
jgi:hypothetical protein